MGTVPCKWVYSTNLARTKKERKRSGAITTRLLSIHLIYIRNSFSETHKNQLRHSYSANTESMSKIWPSDDWFGNVPERNQHLNKLIYCILFQIMLITSLLWFFASNYCFLSCWLAVIISPGKNLIWNNCMFPFALSTLRIICPASFRSNALSLPKF